jgi:hypothetical protein
VVVQDLEKILLEELHYAESPGFLREKRIRWPSRRPIPDVDAALFVGKNPLAYFSRLSELDPDKIRQLHKNVWSQSKAPLLFVTLPHEIRVYNAYEPPITRCDEDFDTPSRLLQSLEGLNDSLTAQRRIREKLVANHYERIYLETGAFWDTVEGRKVNHQTRADHRLVKDMGTMRERLVGRGLSNAVTYTLLGRSIFVRYLEDRGVLTPEWIDQITNGRATSYLESLQSHQVTYLLFETLGALFNGDLFPIDAAERAVDQSHLDIVRSFLEGADLETGQLRLWPYNFAYIPIELISNIYDIFIDDRRSSGAYYTPLLLADFILEETMGIEDIHPDMTVLDPACGSGIFLVGAYRRLVQAWQEVYGTPEPEDLSHLLQASIFGVDKNPEAIRIAVFSLYLEILNHLSNEQIRNNHFRFPRLRGNLHAYDFFDEQVDKYLEDCEFDRIVGNMPWGEGTLTGKGEEWLEDKELQVGGKQAAPAFMLRAPEFCKADGEIALLAPAKSTILVSSETHRKFRKQFFDTYHVRAVVNFSAMRQELFHSAVGPSVTLFYTPISPNVDKRLVYGVPKPSPVSQRLKSIVLDTNDVKFLDQEELVEKPYLWKVALWGTPRDAALIERLKSMPTLREQAARLGWLIKEGIQIGGGAENPGPWLKGMCLVPTAQLRPYFVDRSVCEMIEDEVFHRPRDEEIVKSPLVLIHQSKCYAAFSEEDIAYRHSITGIAGSKSQEWLLKWLVAYTNSSLVKYYHFLTSTRWAVERGNILQKEYEGMPFLIPSSDDARLQEVLQHLDEIKSLQDKAESLFDSRDERDLEARKQAIDALVYEIYGLHPVEQQLVEDTLTYGIGFFNWAKRKTRQPQAAVPVKAPDIPMLKSYAEVFIQVATSLLQVKGQTLNATIYKNGAPLTILSFDLIDLQEAQPVQIVAETGAMRTRLYKLDRLVLHEHTPSFYTRRHVRIYDGKEMSIVRPSERRFWSQSQARVDADAFLAELSM